MDTLQRLRMLLPETVVSALDQMGEAVYEIRLRAGQSVQLRGPLGEAMVGEAMTPRQVREVLSALMDYSLYAREDELRQGFFTLSDGCRVGLCGHMTPDGARMTAIGSACIRLNRGAVDCDERIHQSIVRADGSLCSALILSTPGMGKTTALRALARRLSCAGYGVGIADERHELAACVSGVPTLDVGPRTDVIDGCPKRVAVELLVRSVAPQVIIADEIGGARDADALADAARCGVAVIASAHAGSFEEAVHRKCMRPLIEGGLFSRFFLLGDRPGLLKNMIALNDRGRWHALGAGTLRGLRVHAVREGIGQRRASQGGTARRNPRRPATVEGQHDQHA